MDEVLRALERHMQKRPPSKETAELYLALLKLQGLDPQRQETLEKELKAQRQMVESLAANLVDLRNLMGVGL